MKVVARLLAIKLVLLSLLIVETARCPAAALWSGSVDVTSDYIVHGISRTNDQTALQLDLHYLNTSGFFAGLFLSNAQFDPGEPRSAEMDGFVGFAWSAAGQFRGKLSASHYAYLWEHSGTRYDYDEIDCALSYREWLEVRVSFSPDSPRYSRSAGFRTSSTESVEINVQRPVVGRLTALAGIGYYSLDASHTAGYGYWSVGAAYEFARVSVVASYVNTTSEATALFYNAAATGRWAGTLIWRF